MTKSNSRIAAYLERRIHELRLRRSQAEIAKAAGFRSADFLSRLKSGAAKVPLDRVESLAQALDVDPGEMMPLALQQFFDREVVEMILRHGSGSRTNATANDLTADLIAIGVEITVGRHELAAIKRAVSAVDRAEQKLTARFDRVLALIEKEVILPRREAADDPMRD